MSQPIPKIDIHIVRYNQALDELESCIKAVLVQEYQAFTLTLTENGSRDSIEDAIRGQFGSDPRFTFQDNHENLGFAGAHNKFFAASSADFVMPLNPDAIMQPGFLNELVKVFENQTVAAATGKMLKPQEIGGHKIIDGTGILISRGRRGRERGQLEIDHGQFDNTPNVFGVSGTAPLYRRSALEQVKTILAGSKPEYFDEDFFAYWEDLDLSWRLRLAGFSAVYVPSAIIFHQRVGGQSKDGYRKPIKFIKHHSKLSVRIRRFNWRNHLFTIIKNDFGPTFWHDSLYIIGRELAMLGYIVVFEPRTLGAVPSFFTLLPRMLRKRALIQSHKKATSEQTKTWFANGR